MKKLIEEENQLKGLGKVYKDEKKTNEQNDRVKRHFKKFVELEEQDENTDYDISRPEELETQLKIKYHQAKAEVVVRCMKKLVFELRGSQIYMDKSGIPTMRRTAKTSLRKVN